MKDGLFYRQLFEPEILKQEEEDTRLNEEINEAMEDEIPKRYPTKKELAELYNREEEYYEKYGSHTSVCNVCGKLMLSGDEEYMKQEQVFLEEYDDIMTLCSECSKLPNSSELVKDYMVIEETTN